MFEWFIPFIAGALTTLSPCVLPVLPFVAGSSLSKNRWGPVTLALGLLVTFVGSTLLISFSGHLLGFEPNFFKKIAAIILALSSLLFLFDFLQERLAAFLSRFLPAISVQKDSSLFGEFLAGILLGIIWTPCSGPSLGVALGLATQAETLTKAFLILIVFGLGAILPLLLVAYRARKYILHLREKSRSISSIKKIFGAVMFLFAVMIFFDWEYEVEARLLQIIPEFWLKFTTSF